jgi:hypothetical protein
MTPKEIELLLRKWNTNTNVTYVGR